MNTIFFITINTFKETIRNKILYNILLFAGIIIILSVSFGEWSVFARIQVMEDFGLATMSLSGLLLAVFVGVAMLGKELNSKTVYHMAAKPLARFNIVIGKYLGLSVALILNFILMSIFLFAALFIISGTIDGNLVFAVGLTGCEMLVIVAVALLFSTMTTATLSAILTIAFYIIGHFNDFVDIPYIQASHTLLAVFLKILYYIIPNLEHFNVRTPVIYDIPMHIYYVPLAFVYGILYVILFLMISSAIFARKDL